MLSFDGEYPAVHPNSKFWRFSVKSRKKSSKVCNFIKKETPAFWEIFENTFFTEQLWTTASDEKWDF